MNNSGVVTFIKESAPLLLYLFAMATAILSFFGKVKYGIFFLLPLFPLQNIFLKLSGIPFGQEIQNIVLFGMMVGWLMFKKSPGQRIFVATQFNKILIFYIFYTFISLFIGSRFLETVSTSSFFDIRLEAWKSYLIFFLIFFIVVNNLKTIKEFKILIFIMVISMLLMDYYTFSQISWMSGIESRVRISGTFVYLGPNELAAFYASYTFILITLFLSEKIKILKITYLITVLLNVFILISLYSRAGYLGFIAGLFFLLLVKSKKLLILLIIFLIFWQFLVPTKVVERMNQTHTEVGTLDESSQARLDLWKDSLELFKKNPIFGIGFGSVGFYGLRGHFKDTHNIFLKILTEEGICGLIIVLLIFVLSLKSGWKLYKDSNDNFLKSLGLGFACCVIVFIVTNFFGDRWTHLPLGAYFWTFLALVVRGNIITNEIKRKIKILRK